MNAWRVGVGVFLLTLVLVAIGASWVLTRQQPESIGAIRPEGETTISELTTPSNTIPVMSLPAEDVPGKDMPDLPRYPGAVRVEYEREEHDHLVFSRVEYLSHARVDVIRDFYRGVFRGEGWEVANMEFSEGEWTFLVIHGEREAEVRIEPHHRGVTMVVIESSEPLPEEDPVPEEAPPEREKEPAIQAPAPPQPAPQPAPTPDDDYYYEGDDGDDLGDDGGGDD